MFKSYREIANFLSSTYDRLYWKWKLVADSRPLFIKRADDLPEDLVKSRAMRFTITNIGSHRKFGIKYSKRNTGHLRVKNTARVPAIRFQIALWTKGMEEIYIAHSLWNAILLFRRPYAI